MVYAPRTTRDPWWHIVGLLLGVLYAVLLLLARLYPGTLNVIDRSLEASLAPFQTFGHVEFFLVVTVLGSTLGVLLVALGVVILLRHSRRSIQHLILLLFLAGGSMGLSKAFVERARPDVLLWLSPLNSYSFPSGHATLASALYGFIAVSAYRRAQGKVAKALAVILPGIVVILVALSRLVLNAHYFTDVVAGLLLGLFWLAVICMLPKRWQDLSPG